MNSSVLIPFDSRTVPFLAFGFVGFLLLHKFYIEIRSKFNAKVNCWFCNQNTKVPYLNRNNWTCPQCEQYNGFTKDGDYNREIFEQLDCSNLSIKNHNISGTSEAFGKSQPPRNGFCDVCNEAQRLKIEKLAQFEPKNESRFDEELKKYKSHLEEQYRLCGTCNRHLNKVLREKKKMVLGAKFLDFIIKGAEKLKQPYLNEILQQKREKQKQKLSRLITLIALVNVGCLISIVPILKREHLTQIFGESFGQNLFIIASHILALSRVIGTYLVRLTEHKTFVKLNLFVRSVIIILMYSMGLRGPQIAHLSFSSLFVQATPFMILVLAFVYKLLDNFKLTRFTLFLVTWSAVASGLFNVQQIIMPNVLMILISLLTLWLSTTAKRQPSPKLHDTTANSFHKIYSDDYFSEDSVSILSQQFNCSNSSMSSMDNTLSRSFQTASRLHHQKSPLTSSTYSLHSMAPKQQISPNSSFNTCLQQSTVNNQAYGHSLYAAPSYNFTRPIPTMSPRPTIFNSNLELHRPEHNTSAMPHNTSFLNHSFATTAYTAPPFMPPAHAQQQHYNNSICSTSFPSNPLQGAGMQRAFSAAPIASMHSPFSASTNAMYQDRSTNLLTPSRFSTNSLANNGGSTVNSWLAGNYFQQRPLNVQRNVFGMKVHEDNLSRASSRSSGFESQNEPLNISRENSCIPDFIDPPQNSFSLDNSLTFKPINAVHNVPSSHFSQVNGSTTHFRRINGGNASSPATATRDTFNLRKINEELPTIKRGDLLRKWKESQMLS